MELNTIIPGSTQIGPYIIDQQIGKGAYSTVWKSHHQITGCMVAIKIIAKKTVSKPQTKTRFTREVSLLKQLKFPLIAEFFEILEDANYYYLIKAL